MRTVTNYLRFTLAGLLFPLLSFAEEAGAAAHAAGSFIAPAVGFGIGLAVLGGALAQGRIGSAFMEGAARNPNAVGSMKTQFILALVFVETLILFTLLICFMLLGKM